MPNHHRLQRNRTLRVALLCLLAFAAIVLPVRPPPSVVAAEGFPVRVAVLPSGHLIYSDHLDDSLVEWDPRSGRVVRVIPISGCPTGLAWGWGRLFVGNETTRSVEVYSLGGQLLYTLGGAGEEVGKPSDIAVDPGRGLVFVSDTRDAKVRVYSFRGPLLRTIPAVGETPLVRPTGLAVDPVREEVLVSDFGKQGWFGAAAWVRIYDYEGVYRAGISGNAQADYRFARPQGLAVNEQGLIYLVDSFRNQVLVFEGDSLLGLASLGVVGKAHEYQLWLALDVAIDAKTQDVYVTNNRKHRIEVFRGKGRLP